MHTIHPLHLARFVALGVVIGCSGKAQTKSQPSNSIAGADSGGSNSGVDGGLMLNLGGASSGLGGNGTTLTGCGRCSPDLHSVLDTACQVIRTCPADQGCADGACVPACDSADKNKSSVACDYYALPLLQSFDDAPGSDKLTRSPSCLAAFVANTWSAPVGIRVERAGQELDVSAFARIPTGTGDSITYAPLPNGKLPPGQVAILFLSHDDHVPAPFEVDTRSLVQCPSGVGVAFSGNPAVWGSGIGQGFHITTTAPVVAYDIFPYGGGRAACSSASLLIPTAAWDTNYVAVTPWPSDEGGYPYVSIVALSDGTEVKFRPSTALMGGGPIAHMALGAVPTYSLQRGEYLQFLQRAELAGSAIQSNKPVGVWGSSTQTSLVARSADTLHQQIPPVRALGSEYVAVRHRDRYPDKEESPPWRFVGAADGTMLTYEPAAPSGAPVLLHAGEVVTFRGSGPFVVKSQDASHPFYAAGYMTGANANMSAAGFDGQGDPEFVNVIPPEQYLSSYTFFTDPTYSETSLVLVRKDWGGGFKDVSLDCAGVLTNWQPVDSAGVYQFTRIDLVRGNFEPQGHCDNGVHQIRSEGAFGLTVWGWGRQSAKTNAVSYAYPGGAGLKPINQVAIPIDPPK